MTPLPRTLAVQPDRGMIGFYDVEVDAFDPRLAGTPRDGMLLGNDVECYLHTEQTLEPVTLHFTSNQLPTQPLGQAMLEVESGELVISEITRGAHGPFSLPDGAGAYLMTVHAHPKAGCQRSCHRRRSTSSATSCR